MAPHPRWLYAAIGALALTVACAPSAESTRSGSSSTSASVSTTPTTTGGSTPTTVFRADDAVLDAVQGTWSSDAGTVVFRTDGGADLQARLCPPGPSPERFGYTLDCPPTTASGLVSVGQFTLILARPSGDVDIELTAYGDRDGNLHLGRGHTFAFSPQRQGIIAVPDRDRIAVQGDTCVRADAGQPGGTVPEPCEWRFVDGIKTLEVGGTTYLFDEAAGVVTSPSAYYTIFRRT